MVEDIMPGDLDRLHAQQSDEVWTVMVTGPSATELYGATDRRSWARLGRHIVNLVGQMRVAHSRIRLVCALEPGVGMAVAYVFTRAYVTGRVGDVSLVLVGDEDVEPVGIFDESMAYDLLDVAVSQRHGSLVDMAADVDVVFDVGIEDDPNDVATVVVESRGVRVWIDPFFVAGGVPSGASSDETEWAVFA